MPFHLPNSTNDDFVANNADSFAIAFDKTWKSEISKSEDKDLGIDQKINLVLKKIESHPYLIDNPTKAKQIANFRIRLLNLM